MRRAVGFIEATGCLLCLLVAWRLLRLVECRRRVSPDGRFVAVATCRAWRTHVPMPPGSSGDKPGYVTVFTREGRSCGTAPLPMVWMADDIEWSATRASLPLVAEWDLVAGTVHRAD